MEINHIPASFAARRLTRSWSAGGRPVRKTEMVRARLLARYLARSRACCDEQHNDKRISEAVYSGRLIDSHYYGSERTSASARAQILAPSRREWQRLRLIKNSCVSGSASRVRERPRVRPRPRSTMTTSALELDLARLRAVLTQN